MNLRARSKKSAHVLLFSVRELNKETAQMERILRHTVENGLIVTPFQDSLGALLHPSSFWREARCSRQ